MAWGKKQPWEKWDNSKDILHPSSNATVQRAVVVQEILGGMAALWKE
jgi:hypothetical protein